MRTRVAALVVGAVSILAPALALAQVGGNAVVIGMALEPPGLDPTAGAAAAIGEVTHFNVFEGLTRIGQDGGVAPLLAESWSVADDAKTYTFKLKRGVRFQNGEPCNAETVKFAFERARDPASTNKDKAMFAGIAEILAPDPETVVLRLKEPYAELLFHLGLNTAVIVEPKSAAGSATAPVGTGPYKLQGWVKGASATLTKWEGYRDPAAIKIERVTFRFISEPAAQMAALLAGDVDAFPRFGSYANVAQLEADPRFTVTIGETEGKTILAINNKRKPLDDVRVRRAIAHAIDRKAVIEGALYGFAKPIGSHYVPIDPDYVDLTGTYPFDPAKARALLAEAGVAAPLRLSLKLPPPAYARQSGEVIAAELAQVGIVASIENIEWAQWLDGVFKNKNYDLTIVAHVEPHDFAIYADPNYYFQYDSPEFSAILAKANATLDPAERKAALEAAQRRLADDAVNAFLFQLPDITVAKKGLQGLWRNAPIAANDVAALRWQ